MWVRKMIKKYKREVILCTIFVLLISRFVKSSYVSSRESVSGELEAWSTYVKRIRGEGHFKDTNKN